MTEATAARTVLAEHVLAEHRYTPDPLVPVLGEKWLPRDIRCVASARRFVRDVAFDWNAAEDVPEVAELLASELITNALTHGAAGSSATRAVRVTVSREKALLAVDVHDACPALPQLRQAGSLALHGRGLAIVQAFSHHWGWALTPYGKSVWFQLVAWPSQDMCADR
ncbi:ATP-binding protein [Microbispora bryophytorum]|uniref:ATP-binding protein n=1 Tax=Microbispora bryophytorum subsp. camponoti TaxID=1677852 RepID=A0ABR8L8L5_9ACTN|nr:ATP-binding protein [Microbispora camponoti]MBD3146012.1 ATP-binding protein [Microbispora camponoti]MBD3146957.1 ATP-binding protein [Microbispora camponoti]